MKIGSSLIPQETFENGAFFPQDELHLHVASFLDYNSLLISSLTCKRWFRIHSDHSLIQKFFREKFPDSYRRSQDKNFHRKELVLASAYINKIKSEKIIPSWKTISDAHKGPLKSIQIFEGLIFSGSVDGNVKIWPFENLSQSQILQGENWILCLAVDKNRIYAGSTSGFIFIWDREGNFIKKIKAHNWNVTALKIHEGKLYSSSLDQTIKVWEPDFTKAIKVLQHDGGSVEDLQIFKKEIYGISKGGILGIWSLQNEMKHLKYWNIRNDWIVSSNLTRGIFYFATQEGRVGLINLNESLENRIWNAHGDIVTCLEVSDGLLFSGSWDRTIGIWDAKTGKALRRIQCNEKISSLRATLGQIIAGTECGKLHAINFS